MSVCSIQEVIDICRVPESGFVGIASIAGLITPSVGGVCTVCTSSKAVACLSLWRWIASIRRQVSHYVDNASSLMFEAAIRCGSDAVELSTGSWRNNHRNSPVGIWTSDSRCKTNCVGDTGWHADWERGTTKQAYSCLSAEYRTSPPGGRRHTFSPKLPNLPTDWKYTFKWPNGGLTLLQNDG